ncbi:MAG: hypothetical protein WCT36_01885 [Candidatus Gracilibacteria bacterium]|jgi:hypothetical protein
MATTPETHSESRAATPGERLATSTLEASAREWLMEATGEVGDRARQAAINSSELTDH